MNKGTIIYIGNFDLPDKSAAAHRVVNNGKLFRSLGYRVAYLGTTRNSQFYGIRPIAGEEDMFEEAYPNTTGKWIKHLLNCDHLKDLISRYPDVKLVILYNEPYIFVKAVKKALRNTTIKLAYDCTEWNPYTRGSFIKRFWKKTDEFQIRRRLPKQCDNLIVISDLMRRTYRGKNLLLLPPLVDTDETIWHQPSDSDPAIFSFCFSGTVEQKGRLDRIIQAFSEIPNPDIRFQILGPTKDEYLCQYPFQREIVETDRRIEFEGYRSHADSVKAILSCNCFIFIRAAVRRNQAVFPTKFAEAYTCGTPIITTNTSDIGNYLDAEKGILLSDITPEEIRSAMTMAILKYQNTTNVLNDTFDYRKFLGETEAWINRIS